MINRAKMPRQLRNKGGIMTIGGGGYTGMPMGSRTGFGFISKLKDRVRKLIPNELASVAVKAAPFVAPFNPGIAGLMRGIGRFDQRGSFSDALRQGLATTAFGAGARVLGGASDIMGGGLGGGFTSPLSPERTQSFRGLFEGAEKTPKLADAGDKAKGLKSVRDATGLFKDVPILGELPSIVQQQILVGGASAAATYIYNKFLAEEPPQEEGETIDEYLARRKENVGKKMRTYFDNYFKFDKDYSSMTDEQKDAFVARYNIATGGRVGYQTGGLTMANTLQQNIQRNLANQQAVAQQFARARQQLARQMGTPAPTVAPTPTAAPAAPARTVTPTAAPAAPKITLPKKQPSTGITTVMPVAGGGNVTFGPNIPSTGATAVPGGGGPMMASPGGGLGSMARSMIPAMTQQVSMPAPPPGVMGAGPGFGGFTPEQFSKLPQARQDQIMKEEEKKMNLMAFRMSPIYEQTAMEIPTQLQILKESGFDTSTLYDKSGKLDVDKLVLNKLRTSLKESGVSLTGKETPDQLLQLEEEAKQKILEEIARTPAFQERRSYTGPTDFTMVGGVAVPMAKGGMPTGIMRTNKAGVIERDYRDKGGFVPVGIKEKADDVPAMLSKNEFVFTADAVRGAGNGSIEKGAQRMYDTMKRLEKRMA